MGPQGRIMAACAESQAVRASIMALAALHSHFV
jgi:hypothetical protein